MNIVANDAELGFMIVLETLLDGIERIDIMQVNINLTDQQLTFFINSTTNLNIPSL